MHFFVVMSFFIKLKHLVSLELIVSAHTSVPNSFSAKRVFLFYLCFIGDELRITRYKLITWTLLDQERCDVIRGAESVDRWDSSHKAPRVIGG